MPISKTLTSTSWAGMTDVVPPGYRPPLLPAQAKLYDPLAKGFPLDEYGRYQSMHQVDQWVLLQMSVFRGQAKSAPGMGNQVDTVTHLGQSAPVAVANMVRDALSIRVDAGEVQVQSISVEGSGSALRILLKYRNLVTQTDRSVTV